MFKIFSKVRQMKDKITSAFSLAFSFKGTIWDAIINPIKSAKITNFALSIKKIFENENDKAEALCQTLDLVVQFKKENPQEYQEIFKILEALLETYESDRDSVRQNLKKLL